MKTYQIFLLLIGFFLLSCSESNEVDDMMSTETEGKVKISLTDAPIDNASVKSCFVTISEVQIDGQPVEGFSKTTIDLLAYQNGQVKSLGTFDAEAKTYSEIALKLDFDQSTNGNTPGCYLEENDGTIHNMTMSDNTIRLSKTFDVEADMESSFVMDVDLRKAIKSDKLSDGSLAYDFVTHSEFEQSVRITTEGKTGIVKGKCQNNASAETLIVAYIYEKGIFQKEKELSGQGSSAITFSNAVNSSLCDNAGNFELHFLNEGDYELYFAAYEPDVSGELEFKGLFGINGVLDALLATEVSVQSNTSVSLDVTLSGLLDL